MMRANEMTIETGGYDVMASGSVLTHRVQPITFRKGTLELVVDFKPGEDPDSDEYWVDYEQESKTRTRVVFHNFKGNFMGSKTPIRIGTFDGKPLYLNYMVLTVSPEAERLLHYTWYLGQ